jgi:hypothetical protein
MMLRLSVPKRLITRGLKGLRRERRVTGFDFLQASNVGLGFFEKFEQSWEAAIDAVNVECGYFHSLNCRQIESLGLWPAHRLPNRLTSKQSQKGDSDGGTEHTPLR